MNATLHMTATERAREAAVMAERERVYRDVHDTVARALGDVLLRLDAVERSGAERSHDIIRAKRAARDALTETRRTVLGLAPSGLDTDALIDAIRLELTWAESAAGLKSDLTIVGVRQPMPATVGYQLFRIVKEALTNVVEHARASRMRVGIVYGQAKITMLIEDDGCGFDLQAIQPQPGGPSFRGLGLQGLVARAHHVGGEVHIESTPGWGTHLRVEMPLAENPQSVRQGGDRWRVLVAHERPIVRAGLVRMLATAEPEIQVVGEITRTDEAVDACALLRPNVLLADLDGSAIDGVRLSSYIRSSSPDVAVVLLVGSFDDVDVQDAARNGAAAFVSRDAEATELTRAVVAAARRDAFVTTLPTVTDPHDDNSRPRLTPREREVRRLVEQGLQDKQIARELSISIKTVEKHVGSILRKTGAANRTTLARESSRRRD
ncbi:LuxR C-terminal-related transcriptional regulator [Actinopolymorpha pittospori]